MLQAIALQAMATGHEPIHQLGIETILRSRAVQPDRRQALQENAGTGQHLRSLLSRQPEQARLAAIGVDLLQQGAEHYIQSTRGPQLSPLQPQVRPMRQKSIRRHRAVPTAIVVEKPALFTGLSRQQLTAGHQHGGSLEGQLSRQICLRLQLRVNQQHRTPAISSRLEQCLLLRDRQRSYQHQPSRRPGVGLQELQISVWAIYRHRGQFKHAPL